MGSFIHHDLIAEKLEIARTMGLVTDYFVGPTGSAPGPSASVKAWCRPDTDEASIRAQLARLLHGLVADDHIVLITPVSPVAVAPATADEGPPLDSTAVPVAA